MNCRLCGKLMELYENGQNHGGGYRASCCMVEIPDVGTYAQYYISAKDEHTLVDEYTWVMKKFSVKYSYPGETCDIFKLNYTPDIFKLEWILSFNILPSFDFTNMESVLKKIHKYITFS